jgi:hypothetical protein
MNLSVNLTNALEILREVDGWRLSPERWEAILPILEAIAVADRANDAAALRQASIDLALAGSTRFKRVGAETRHTPPPPVVRERVNHLVHALERGQGAQSAR